MRFSPLWVFAVLVILTFQTVAEAQTAANPIAIKTPIYDPAPFKPNEDVVLTSATAVRPPAGFFSSPHTLSLSFSWAISGASGPLTTLTTVVQVVPPYTYSPTAGPTSTNPIILSTGTLSWDPASVAGGCLPDGKFGTLISVSGAVDQGSPQAITLRTATRPVTLTCKGDLPVLSDLSPVANTLLASSSVTVSGRIQAVAGGSVLVNGVTAAVNGTAFTAVVGLQEGATNVPVVAQDCGGRSKATTLRLVVDTVPLTLAMGTPSDGAATRNEFTPVTVTIHDPVPGSGAEVTATTLRVDGVDVTSNATRTASSIRYVPTMAFSDGSHQVAATARDKAGNATTLNGSFRVDTVNPVVQLTPPAESFVLNTQPTFTASWSDATPSSGISIGTLQVLLDGEDVTSGSMINGSSLTFTPTSPLGSGNHSLVVKVRDFAGNVGSASKSFKTDAAPPSVTIVSPASMSVSALSSAAVFVEYSGSASGIAIKTSTFQAIRDGTNISTSFSKTTTSARATLAGPLSEGDHTLNVSIGDVYGLVGHASSTWTVDTRAPVVSVISPSNGTTLSSVPQVQVSFSDPTPGSGIATGSFSATLDGQPIGNRFTVTSSGATWTLDPVSQPVNGQHLLTARIADRAGHVSTASVSFAIAGAAPDTVAPVVTLSPASGTLLATGVVSLSADLFDAAPSSGLNLPGSFHATLDGQDVTASASLSGNHATLSFSASSPLADGSHQWSVRVSDQAGNEGAATSSFQIDSRAPTLLIESPADGSTVTTTTPSYSATFADPSPGSGLVLNSFKALIDGIDRTAAFLVAPTGATFETPPSDPLPAGAHSVLMEIADTAGHRTSSQSSFIIVPQLTGATGTLFGEIRTGDPCNSSALSGATVRVVPTGNVTITDASGRFSLAVPSGQGWLEVSRPGYLSVQRSFEAVAGQESSFPTLRLAAEDSHSTHIVAASGGTATDSTGKVTLDLPPGALPRDLDIVLTLVTSPDQTLGPPVQNAIPGVSARISPEGITLNAPAKLRIRSPFFTAGHPILAFDWNPHTQTRERISARVIEDGFYESTINHFSGADAAICSSVVVLRAGSSRGSKGPSCGAGGGKKTFTCKAGGGCGGPSGGPSGPSGGPGGADAAGGPGGFGPAPAPGPSGPVGWHASPTVMLKTGHLSEAHQLAPINILNRSRTLTFVYDSSTADPAPVITTDYTLPVTPSALHIRAQAGRYLSDTHYVPRAGTIYHAFQWDATDSSGEKVPTGVYPVNLSAYLSTTATLAADETVLNWNVETVFPIEGAIALQNNRKSPFGAGWSLAELDRLVRGARGSVMWAGGAGESVVYDQGYMTQPVAGKLTAGFSGDGGPATQATFNGIADIAPDGQGGWFLLDLNNHRIRRINSTGVVTTWAGTGTTGPGIDGPATSSPLENPIAISAAPSGELFIAELVDDQEQGPYHRIRKIDTSGNISTVFRDEFQFRGIVDLAYDPSSNTLLVLTFEQIFRVTPGSGQLAVVFAGAPTSGYAGDSEPARLAKFSDPSSIAVDNRGRVAIVDAGNRRVRLIDETGVTHTIGGTGTIGRDVQERTLGVNADLALGKGASVAFTPDGDVIFTEPSFGLVRRIRANGLLQSIGGALHPEDRLIVGKDTLARGAALTTNLGKPARIAAAPDGRIALVAIAETDEFANHVRTLETSLDGRAQLIAPPGFFVSLTREVDGSYTQTTQEGVVHTYNPEGFKTATRDLNGNETTYSYTTTGLLSSVREPTGQAWTFTYVQGKLSRVEDHTGRATLFDIDPSGNLLSITDPGPSTFKYTYDSAHRLVGWLNPVNNGGTVTYTPRGHVARIDHADTSFDTYQPQDAVALLNDVAVGTGTFCSPMPLTMRDDVRAVRVDTRAKTWAYQLDEYGQPLLSIDPLGRTFKYVRRDTGQPLEVTRPNGSKVKYSYGFRNEIVKEEDDGNVNAQHPAPAVKTYAYAADRVIVTSMTDTLDATSSVTLDAHANPIGVTRPEGVTETNTYDSRGLLTQHTDGRQKTTTYTYDTSGNLERITFPDQTTRVYTRTSQGYEASVSDEDNHVTRFTYHPFGLLASMEDALNQTESWTYDVARRRTTHTNRRSKTASMEYDVRDRLIKTISPSNRINATAYDSEGNVISRTDAKGRTTTYEYDDAGQLVKQIQPGDVVTQYRYTLDVGCSCGAGGLLGKVSVIVDPRQGETHLSHDKSGRTTSVSDALQGQTTYKYDLNGMVVREEHPDGWIVSRQYDELQRLVSKDSPVSSDLLEYDKCGNVVNEIVNSSTRTREYDARNRLKTLTEESQAVTRFEYTGSGDLKALVTPNQNRWTFEYDDVHRLKTETDPLGRSTTFTYDENGNLLTTRDRKGQLTRYTYNDEDEKTSITYHDGSRVDLDYDATGKLTTVSDARVSVTRSYDELDRLQSLSIPQLARTLTMEYDKSSNRTALDVNGARTTYTYDALNRLKTLLHSSGAEASWDYDPAGLCTRKTLPHGIVADMSYSNRRLSTMSYKKPDGSPLQAFVYTYNPDSTIQTMLDSEGMTTYTYDGLKRLTQVQYPSTSQLSLETFTYDPSGNRTHHARYSGTDGIPFSDLTITYDAADQILSAVEPQPPAPPCPEPRVNCLPAPPPDRIDYIHDLNGNLTATTSTKYSQAYDFGSGSYPATVATTTFTYDARNRLTQSTLPGGQVQSSEYYPDSPLRLSFSTPGAAPGGGGAKTIQLWDPITRNPLQDLDDANVLLTNYLMGNEADEVLASIKSGVTHTVIGDHLGSVKGLADSSGSFTNRYAYEAFGASRWKDEGVANRLRFSARELDDATGMQYNRSRHYAPRLGRWTQFDSLGFELHNPNLYTYVGNRPSVNTDPHGMLTPADAVDVASVFIPGAGFVKIVRVGGKLLFMLGAVELSKTAIRRGFEWADQDRWDPCRQAYLSDLDDCTKRVDKIDWTMEPGCSGNSGRRIIGYGLKHGPYSTYDECADEANKRFIRCMGWTRLGAWVRGLVGIQW